MRRLFISILLCTFVIGLFSHDADARRRRRRSTKKRQTIINEKKLYERLGGSKAMATIVDEWMRLNFADARIASMFSSVTAKPEKIGKLRKDLNDQLCELSDGPCQYRGPDSDKIPLGMKINDQLFLVFSYNLYRSLEKQNVAEREKDELLARVGEASTDNPDNGLDQPVKKQ